MQTYGIGLPSYDNAIEAPLPFRMAGIIYTTQSSLLPLIFLALIHITEYARGLALNKYIVISYICIGIAGGIITTSKASSISTLISLLVLWLLIGRMSSKRIYLALAAIPLIALFNVLIGVIRNIYWSSPDLSLFNALIAGQDQIQNAGSGDNFPAWFSFATPLLRISGFDSLLSILAYFKYHPSPEEPSNLIFVTDPSAAEFYTNIILGWSSGPGTMFAPSLLGTFYIANQNIFIVCLAFVIYTFSWGWLFNSLRKLNLSVGPALTSLVIIQLAFYTSDGNLESIPQKISLLLLFGLVTEWLLLKLRCNIKRS